MFEHLLTLVDQPADRVLHVGDNPYADVDVPRSLGLRAAWLPAARSSPDEGMLSDSSWSTAGLGAAFAGAGRLARCSVAVRTPREAAIRDVTAGVAAPVLVGYVLWTLQRARHHGLRRVSYLARDGQVLADVADRLVDRLGLDVAVDYLAVSRQSTNLAATFDVDAQETDWVFRDVDHLAPDELLERFDMVASDVAPHLDVTWPEGDAPVSTAVAAELRHRLEQPGPLRDHVLRRAAERRDTVMTYLAQHGLVGQDPLGIVDFGGVGSQVRAVHRLVREAGGRPPRILLVGLDDPLQAGLELPDEEPAWVADTETWLYDHRRDRGIRRGRGFGTCVQMFCAADHGTVTGYRATRDGVVPTMSEEVDHRVVAWGLPVLRATVGAVIDHLVLDDDLVDADADMRAVDTALVDRFWSDPTPAEAEAWGAFPFEGAQATATEPVELAYPYTLPLVVRGMADGWFPNLGWQHWYEGSLQMTSAPVRAGLRLGEAGFRMLRRSDNAALSRVVRWARARRA